MGEGASPGVSRLTLLSAPRLYVAWQDVEKTRQGHCEPEIWRTNTPQKSCWGLSCRCFWGGVFKMFVLAGLLFLRLQILPLAWHGIHLAKRMTGRRPNRYFRNPLIKAQTAALAMVALTILREKKEQRRMEPVPKNSKFIALTITPKQQQLLECVRIFYIYLSKTFFIRK